MADKGVTISINTTANVAGAVEAKRSIDVLADANSEAAITTSTLTDKEVAAAKAIGEATRKFNEEALAKLKAARLIQSSGLDIQKVGILANQASYQLGDFVTQVQMGTSGIRAFSQQAPQLIGAFSALNIVSGPVGIALGAISVAIPLVAMGFEKLSSTSDTLKPKIDAINESLETNAKLLLEAYEAHRREQQEAEESAQKWPALEAAKNSASRAAISNAQKELEAYEVLNESLGIKLDLIGTKADMEKAGREESARQAANAESTKSAESVQQIVALTNELNDLRSHISYLENELKGANKRVALERADMNNPELTTAARADSEQSFANEYGKKLVIEKALQGFNKQAKDLEQKIEAQTTKANDQIQASNEAIQEIDKTLSADNNVGLAKEVKERSSQQADDLKSILAGITPLNDSQKAHFEALQGIVSNGKVTASESAAMGQHLSSLVGGVQSGISAYSGTVQSLLALVQQMIANDREYKIQVSRLNSQMADAKKMVEDLKRNK